MTDAAPPDPPAPPAIEWRAPAACPDQAAVNRKLSSALARRQLTPPARQLAVARVARVPGGYELELRLTRDAGSGQRELAAGSCDELAQAVALIVALSLERQARQARDRGAEEPAPKPPDERDVSDASEPEPLGDPGAGQRTPTTVKRRRRGRGAGPPLRLALSLSPELDVGSLPDPAPGVAATLGVRRGWWALDLGYRHLPTQTVELPRGPGEARLQLHGVHASACLLWPLAGHRLGPCLDAEVAVVHGTTRSISEPSSGESLLVSARGGARWERPRWLGPVGVRGDVAVGRALSSRRFVVRGRGPVHEPGPWLFRAAVGVTLSLP